MDRTAHAQTRTTYRFDVPGPAARHLARLHGRYLLRRKSTGELELDIIDSWQGDAVLPLIMASLGVETTFNKDGIFLKKSGTAGRN